MKQVRPSENLDLRPRGLSFLSTKTSAKTQTACKQGKLQERNPSSLGGWAVQHFGWNAFMDLKQQISQKLLIQCRGNWQEVYFM